MQTQHKVQLDARDKGQAPAGQPGPYQVCNALQQQSKHNLCCLQHGTNGVVPPVV